MHTTPRRSTPDLRRRAGGIAGVLITLPVAALSTIIVLVGENLRQYGTPWLLSATAVLTFGCFAGLHSVQAAPGRRLEMVGYACSSAALIVVAGFFAVLGLEDLIDNLFGTGRFLSSNGAITAAGTLIGSLASMVVLPTGLVLYGIATVRARCVSSYSRWLPLAIPLTVVGGAALASAVSTQAASLLWIWAVALCCARLGVVLLTWRPRSA
jgi:hypothetical protein